MRNRLGVYSDDVYLLVEHDSRARISSERSFLLFARTGLTLEAEGARVAKFVDLYRSDGRLRVGFKTSAANRPLQRLRAGPRKSRTGRT